MNLEAARRVVAKHSTDSCRITRDRQGVYDDVLDMATGKLLARPLTPAVVYDGPCLVTPTGIGQTVEGARVMERRGYRVRLPHDAPPILRGDTVTVRAADPELDARQLSVVDSSQGGTLDPCCTLNCQDPTPVAAQ